MKRLFASSIKNKILYGFCIIVLLVLVEVAIGNYKLADVSESSKLVVPRTESMVALKDLALLIAEFESTIEQLYVVGGVEEASDYRASAMKEYFARLINSSYPEQRELVDELEAILNKLEQEVDFFLNSQNGQLGAISNNNRRLATFFNDIERAKDLHQLLSLKTIEALREDIDTQSEVLDSTIMQLTFMAIAVLVLAIALSLVISKHISRPVEYLQEAVMKFGSDGIHEELKILSSDEIGVLTRSFESMRREIIMSRQELESYNKDLETKVDERTRQLEELAQKADLARKEAEQAAKVKSEFLANMSHEIRTPMNGVLGMTELVIESDLTNEQLEQVQVIRESALSLLSIINDILDFSKLESGQFVLDSARFSLTECLEKSLRPLAVKAFAKNLEIILHTEVDVPSWIVGDEGRLVQIINNLVGNAIKFTEQGEIFIYVSLVQQEAAAYTLKFEIIDSGIGISSEKHGIIFDSFSQADGSTSRHYGGTGLGLTISSRLVKLMQGEMGLSSEIGKGSNFFFTAKFGADDPVENVMDALPGHRLMANLSALIVDGNKRSQSILTDNLEGWEWNVCQASSWREGVHMIGKAIAAKKPYRLLLINSFLPDLNDGDVIQLINHYEKLNAAISIIILKTYYNAASPINNMKDKHLVFLNKPISRQRLYESIGVAIGLFGAETESTPQKKLTCAKSALKILIAEDNGVNQTLASQLLIKRGHTVTLAGDGHEAIELWRKNKFDLILMDLQMPKMDGIEATRIIRRREAKLEEYTPIIALTAHALEGVEDRCRAIGMDAFIAKPFQAELFFSTIERVTEGFGAVVSETKRYRPV